ncbi:hypothetical protein HR45_02610 [Shewanella mangrovi]|uniref:Uncharacterized protein n=1 Tax=Shewanella mangrovi TaxID=1515746 RepID=A0A094JGQ4_9GAMM|nr:hypothetical protein HR45_02610 [Shewanella mangrovi]
MSSWSFGYFEQGFLVINMKHYAIIWTATIADGEISDLATAALSAVIHIILWLLNKGALIRLEKKLGQP